MILKFGGIGTFLRGFSLNSAMPILFWILNFRQDQQDNDHYDDKEDGDLETAAAVSNSLISSLYFYLLLSWIRHTIPRILSWLQSTSVAIYYMDSYQSLKSELLLQLNQRMRIINS